MALFLLLLHELGHNTFKTAANVNRAERDAIASKQKIQGILRRKLESCMLY